MFIHPFFPSHMIGNPLYPIFLLRGNVAVKTHFYCFLFNNERNMGQGVLALPYFISI